MLPGLIDAHTHTFADDALKDAVVFGVTTELDMFTDVKYVQQVKQLEAAGKNRNMADLRSAGTLATAPAATEPSMAFRFPRFPSQPKRRIG